jgi:hypothetical protein
MLIEDQIIINQLAQNILDRTDGETWFDSLDPTRQMAMLNDVFYFIKNTSPHQEDAMMAIAKSGLKTTYTPCVLLTKYDLWGALAKIKNLPIDERPKVFKLAVTLLGISDERRRAQRCSGLCSHWWHRDLGDRMVIEQIRKEAAA